MPRYSLTERIARLQDDRTVKDKCPFAERRQIIALKMIHPDTPVNTRHMVLTFTRKVTGARDLNHFFDRIATEYDVKHIERLLGIIP